ncbi:MAG: hypothetical protein CVU38_07560 [Chloroflexi bacterium HGW-Chloroflexi-1]|nr:MAG: hypothetical protein CVU38_07560 [Chloroflexi bacterium HGW-Chloroflexi-1]
MDARIRHARPLANAGEQQAQPRCGSSPPPPRVAMRGSAQEPLDLIGGDAGQGHVGHQAGLELSERVGIISHSAGWDGKEIEAA